MNKTRFVYCPTCGRDVRIVTTPAASASDGHATIPDPGNVCLDFSASCEARDALVDAPEPGLCPVFGTPSLVMGVARARSGVGAEARGTSLLPCEVCGMATDQELVGTKHAVCRICGVLNVLDKEET